MKYAKLAPGSVADEAAEVLDQLATENGTNRLVPEFTVSLRK